VRRVELLPRPLAWHAPPPGRALRGRADLPSKWGGDISRRLLGLGF
jgi:hypothetical protein